MKKSFAIIESLPLLVFLIFAALVGQGVIQGWLSTYVISSIVALITSTILMSNKISLNRLFVGINIYLFTGSVGLMTDQVWLNQLYGKMEASGMLAWIIVVGVVSLILSPAGFIGVESANRKKITFFSLYLLIVALIAFLFSYYFNGNKLYSEIIPFVVLFAAHNILKSKALTSSPSPS